jgi:hypothetical protein
MSPALIQADVPAEDCQPVPGIKPFCDLQAPEDMVLSPGAGAIIFGEFGGLIDPAPGQLTRLDLASESFTTLYPKADADGTPDWGDKHCPGAPGAEFSPHGLHLSQRANGDWQLLAVNHRGRESVEFFHLDEADQLTWRGCVVMPENAFLNDIVALPEGGFLATHMADRNDPELIATLLSGRSAGAIWSWQPDRGVTLWDKGPLPFPNGIALSADGKTVFVNFYGVGEVRKIERATGEVLGIARIEKPDNSSWSDDGRLLIASHVGEADFENGECLEPGARFCPMAFQIVALDPASMTTQVLFEHQGAPMGAGTVAIKQGNQLYIGSYIGDRLIKVTLPAPANADPSP